MWKNVTRFIVVWFVIGICGLTTVRADELVSSNDIKTANPAPDWYCGAYSTYNPFAWSDLYGQCTWYAFGRALERTGIDVQCTGNAKTWYGTAQSKGFEVGSTPRADSIVVWNYGEYGHVAYVEEVNGNIVTVSEANNKALGNWTDQREHTLVGGINCYSGMHNWTKEQMKGRYTGESLIGYIYLKNNEITEPLVITAKTQYDTSEDITFTWNSPANAVSYGITVYTRPASGNRVMVFDIPELTTGHSYNLGKYSPGDYRLWMAPYNSSGTRGTTTYVDFTVVEHAHKYTSKITQHATCEKEGIRTYRCACGNTYTEKISKTSHVYKQKSITAATEKTSGYIRYKCENCNATNLKTIAQIKSVTISSSSYEYNGFKKTPSVLVKDSKGNKLKKDTDYTVSYSSGRKNPGKYTVKVEFKGNYKGSITKSFTIKPKNTKITNIVSKSKTKVQVAWKKQSTKTSGYEIQYSTTSNFSGKTTKTLVISSNKTTKKTISSLKSNKRYYVRVRTYVNEKKNGKITKIYSKWSGVKSIKCK